MAESRVRIVSGQKRTAVLLVMNDDRELLNSYVDRLLDGDREAVATLSLAITRYLYRFGGRRLADPENTKAEVIAAVIQNLRRRTFAGVNLRQFNAYLRSIVLNTVLRDMDRDSRIITGTHSETYEPQTADDSDAIANRETVEFVLDRIGPECSELLRLKFLQELSNAEIAAKFKVREVTVRVRVYRCMECAREVMKKHGLL